MAALDAGVRCARSRSPFDTPTHARPPIYDGQRQNFDRHAAYVVVAFIAGG
jgi:hypothetical protein